MSIGPSEMASSAAVSALSQTQGPDTGRTQQESTDQVHQVKSRQNAKSSSEIGQTERDEEVTERDADGRRLREQTDKKSNKSESADPPSDAPQSRDATGQRGQNLDLSV